MRHETTVEFHAQLDISLSHFSYPDHLLPFLFLLLFPTYDSVEQALDLTPVFLRVYYKVDKWVGNQYTNLLFYFLSGVVPPEAL